MLPTIIECPEKKFRVISRKKSVCDECCQLTYKEKKKNFKKRLQQLFNDEKKYLEKWF